ncbi:MAG: hypothetical protein WAQ98_29410 [Blastocatellia bacterium]
MLMRASDISKGNQKQNQVQSHVEVATLASSPTSLKLASSQSTRELPTMLEKDNVKMALVAPSIYWISYN